MAVNIHSLNKASASQSSSPRSGEKVGAGEGLVQLVDDTAGQHRLALARVTLDPEQPALLVG